jgi:NAD(P)-dependent dehydrogenase (short-subunit alcohol dehydrogenase family)
MTTIDKPAANTTDTGIKRPIALITGGSRGLGKATALALAKRGTDIVLTYRSAKAEADAVVADIQALGRQAVALPLELNPDNTVPLNEVLTVFSQQLTSVLQQQWQRSTLDYLVNNAGIGINKSFLETTEEDLDSLFQLHFRSVFFLTRKLLPMLADGGAIINISSGLTRFCGAGFIAYASMKGAIEVFSRYLAAELGPRGIRVNTVAPGAIETDFGGGVVRDIASVNRQLAEHTALGRVGVVEDIGPMIAALLSDDQRWVNAQRIEASGGMFL